MQERHLIALDLDGTLLNDESKISNSSKKIIQQLIADGHIVVIATGRSNRVCLNYYNELELNSPLVTANGAFIYHPQNENWEMVHTPLPQDMAFNIVDLARDIDVNNILATVRDHVYLDKFDDYVTKFYNKAKSDKSFSIGPIDQNLNSGPTGMLLFPDIEQIDPLNKALESLDQKIVNYWSWGEPMHVVELMNRDMNKWRAIKQIASQFEIADDKIIAFGDGANDLEMIGNAGVGVAMENAIAPLQSVAKYHTDTNENHGVAQFLNDYFQLKQNVFSL